MEKLN